MRPRRSERERGARVRTRPGRRRWLATAVLGACLLQAGCLNHYQIHPRQPPDGVVTWSENVVREPLLLRIEGARPAGRGPFPAVLVHPEARHRAREMRGILHSLAERGYLAMAVDYKRRNGRDFDWTLFPWREQADAFAAFELLAGRPDVDPARIATMGYSQGAIFSLLIAANGGEVAAVVAYYPVTDFVSWLDDEDLGRLRRFAARLANRSFRRLTGSESDEELRRELKRFSAYWQAEKIEAPVLLIHGARDRTAGVRESRRLHARLRELGRTSELLVLDDAGHVFNFKSRPRAQRAWTAATGWLDRHLTPKPAAEPADEPAAGSAAPDPGPAPGR